MQLDVTAGKTFENESARNQIEENLAEQISQATSMHGVQGRGNKRLGKKIIFSPFHGPLKVLF